MNRLKAVIKAIFFPPPLLTVLLAALGYAAMAAVFALEIENPVIRYPSFLASAYALAITVTGFRYLRGSLKKCKTKISESAVAKKIRSSKLGEKYFSDIHFRNRISLYIGLAVNLAYIVMKLSAGIYYRSEWFVSLAVYYMLLAVMRLFLIRPASGRAEEFKRYRFCGFVLLIMNQALAGIVIFMVHQNEHFSYPGYLIYAMAAYSFYAIITASVNVVKTRRHNSPVLSATKAVNFVAALVSILSLTTAMLAQFGGDDAPTFRRAMTASVGGAVCTIVIAMAAYMIWRANKSLRRIKM